MRALIVGIDGGIGRALASHFDQAGIAWAGTSRRPEGRAGVHALDLATLEGLDALPEADVVYLCAAMTKQAECRANPELSRRVNVDAPVAIARHARARGGRVVFLSSTAVFNGAKPYRTEDEAPCPKTTYGIDKAGTEARLLELGGAAVLRLAKVLTPDLALIAGWIAALSAGNPVKPFHDMGIAPIGVDEVCAALAALGEKRAEGIFHQSGARDQSYASLAAHVAARLGADATLVQPWSRVDAGINDADCQTHTCLATPRLTALTGFVPPEPEAVVDRVYGL